MMAMLPSYYDNSKVMRELQNAIGEEMDRLRDRLDQIDRELSPSTAVETIGDWEKEYGIISTDAPIDVRRAAVIAAMWAVKTTTKKTLRALAETTLGIKCEVTESADGLRVIVSYFGETDADAIHRFMSAAEKIMPAHVELFTAQKPKEPEHIYIAATALMEKHVFATCEIDSADYAAISSGDAAFGETV